MRKAILVLAVLSMVGCTAPWREDVSTHVPMLEGNYLPGDLSAEPGSKWTRAQKYDEMRRKMVVVHSVESENTVSLRPPYEKEVAGMLVVRNESNGRPVAGFIASSGQIVCDRQCSIGVRFDDDPVSTYVAQLRGHTRGTIEFTSPKFTADLLKSRRAIVEVDFYPDGQRQFKFLTAGLVPSPS